MRVAIVHYWFVGMRGGEKVVEQLCALYPDADIYTHVVDPDAISDRLKRHAIRTTGISRLPFARRLYQSYLPFMPRALEALDLRGYDLVLSSESGPAKGVIADPDARHVCYCHSPMRYLWDEHHGYLADASPLKRLVFSLVAPRLRLWDAVSASRVDRFVANSSFIARRVARAYGREADVVNPPVDLGRFSPLANASAQDEPFYLMAGELVGYKRADIAIGAFAGTGRRLLIAGDGAMRARLERGAPAEVRFLGRVSDDELTSLYQRCRALVFPGREDFGIVPLEAMACGRPVIAYGRGGVLDSVTHGRTGLLFDEQTPEGLRRAVDAFEAGASLLPSAEIALGMRRFSEEAFRSQMKAIIDEVLAEARLPGHGEAPTEELAAA